MKSLWSINDNVFSLRALIVVIILVAFGTYFIVFNLNNVVGCCERLYTKRKRHLIEEMRRDPDKSWSEQGKRFVTFHPKQENVKPSEWTIILFVLHNTFRWFHIRREFTKPKSKKSERQNEAVINRQNPSFSVEFTSVSATTVPKERSSMRSSFGRLGEVFRRGALSKAGVSTNV
jgi:hypothetical protein